MNSRVQVGAELKDLLAYFPGRGRLPLVWLLILPIVAAEVTRFLFGRVVRVAGTDQIPFYLSPVVEQSVLWLWLPAAFVCLLRINHSRRTSLRESGCILISSVFYGIVIGVPAVLATAVWAICHVGVSVLCLLQGLVGIAMLCASTFLVVFVLGLAAHYLGFFVPLLLLFVKTYVYFIPVVYSMDMLPEHWRIYTVVIPLAPEVTILRNAILNSVEHTPTSCWVGAAVHTTIGIAAGLWLWKRITEPAHSADG